MPVVPPPRPRTPPARFDAPLPAPPTSNPNTKAPTAVPLSTPPSATAQQSSSSGDLWGWVVISVLGVVAAVVWARALRRRGG